MAVIFYRAERISPRFLDPLADFDPVNDLAQSSTSFLTWRLWEEQRTVGGAWPYALMEDEHTFVKQPKDWMGIELPWMQYVMRKLAKNGREGWTPSNYRGLFAFPQSTNPFAWAENRINMYNMLVADRPEDILPVRIGRGSDFEVEVARDGQLTACAAAEGSDAFEFWKQIVPELVFQYRAVQVKRLAA